MAESGADRQTRIDRRRIRAAIAVVEMDNPERSRVLLTMERADHPLKAGEAIKMESYLARESALRLRDALDTAIGKLWP